MYVVFYMNFTISNWVLIVSSVTNDANNVELNLYRLIKNNSRAQRGVKRYFEAINFSNFNISSKRDSKSMKYLQCVYLLIYVISTSNKFF